MFGAGRSRWLGVVVGTAILLPLVACGPSQPTAGDRAEAASTAVPPNADGSPPDPTAAPSGEAWPLVGGGTLDIGTLADRPLALWFWAPG